jgi:aspartate/methionine/tyrosine aminotransferase
MKSYRRMSKQELQEEKVRLEASYNEYKARDFNLNMARGKPGNEQLDLSMPMLDILNSHSNCIDASGVDCRNFGELYGISEARKLFAEYMKVSYDELIVVGSSSLIFMYDCMARAMLKGVLGSEAPWGKYGKIKFLCPVPGYDRHFAMCEFLGIEMINIPQNEWGPNMDLIEKSVAEDETVKGIFCVPKYGNPLGTVYSDEAVRRLAGLKPAAKDFRIFWDNAYEVHYVYKDVPVLNLLDECKKAGNPNMAYMFGSTSKITIPGAGVAFFAASEENIRFTAKQLNAQALSWDKVNMLRHVRFLKDMDGIRAIMEQHATLLRPHFDALLNVLDEELSGRDAGDWTKPNGGYFVTFIAEKGCARRIVELCKEAGVSTTDAGATHPYHNDPEDVYIRLAPSFSPVEDIRLAAKILSAVAKVATVEKLLAG